jgi:hypothetical protein
MKKGTLYLAAVICVFALFSTAEAAPMIKELPYQKATALTAGVTYTFRFSLWDALTGGTMQWSEEQAIKLTSTLLKHNLGSTTPFGTLDFGQQMWVQVERKKLDGTYVLIGTRDRLSIAAYSLYSADSPISSVTGVNGLTGGGAVGDLTISPDYNYVQKRLNAYCSPGWYLRGVDVFGNITCQADAGGTVTGVLPGTGLTGGGYGGNVTLSADMNVVERKFVAGPSTYSLTSFTLASGNNYQYTPAFTLASSAVCMVTASAQLSLSSSSPYIGPYFRIAVKRGTADGDDGAYGHYFPVMSNAGLSADLTRTTMIFVYAGQATQFGCFYGANYWVGAYADCQVSYVCF